MKEGVFRKTLALDFFVFLFFYIQAALALHMSVERYPGKNNLVVCNNAKLCIHSRHCVTQLTNVFKPNTPGAWIDPNAASREAVISTIVRCPSGALTYETTDGTPGEQAPSVNIVRTWENGPYEFRGDLRIEGQEPSFRATLCRCGRSKNKPFCDKSHELAGFYATGEPETNPSDALPHRDGLLHIIPQKDGPYVVKGSLELCAASGRTVGRTAYTQLCRCGASQTKPFCDGSHAREGFKSDNGHEIPHDAGRHNAPAYREQHATTLEGVLAEQYSNQLQLLERTGLLKEGEMIDIGGKTHRLPSVAEFTERLRSKKEFIESKYREGFTRLLVVPFGAPLSRFHNAQASLIAEHRSRNALFDSDGNAVLEDPADSNEMWTWPGLLNADVNEMLLYFPNNFSDTPRADGAKSKRELPPFQFLLTEDFVNLPRRGNMLGERHHFIAGQTPREYLYSMLWNGHHEGERGFTPEAAAVDFMRRLSETNTVTDDKTVSYLLGSYLYAGRFIPHSKWMRETARAVLGANEVNCLERHYGARTAVEI